MALGHDKGCAAQSIGHVPSLVTAFRCRFRHGRGLGAWTDMMSLRQLFVLTLFVLTCIWLPSAGAAVSLPSACLPREAKLKSTRELVKCPG